MICRAGSQLRCIWSITIPGTGLWQRLYLSVTVWLLLELWLRYPLQCSWVSRVQPINICCLHQAGTTDNSAFQPIVDKLSSVSSEGDEVEISGVTLAQLMPADKTLSRFFRYSGSLTTPSCNEVVTWTVLEKTVSISEQQVILPLSYGT